MTKHNVFCKGFLWLVGIFVLFHFVDIRALASEGFEKRRLGSETFIPEAQTQGALMENVYGNQRASIGRMDEKDLQTAKEREEDLDLKDNAGAPEGSQTNPYLAVALALLGLLGVGGISKDKALEKAAEILPKENGLFVKEGDRETIRDWVNTAATKNYEMNDTGFLKPQENAYAKEGSKTFTEMIDKLIGANQKTVLGFSDKVFKLDHNGNMQEEKIEGMTVGKEGSNQVILINPEYAKKVGDKESIALLSHEMAHAVDALEGTKTQDAKRNEQVAMDAENRVREELGLSKREFDATNAAGDGIYSLWDSGATSTRRVIGGGAPTPNRQTEQKDYLKNGSKGENVKKVQQMLRELGYGIGSAGVDGIFGKDTENAVKKFQKDWGLSVDGIVGNQTLESLKALSNLRNAPDFVDKKQYMEDLIKKIPQGKADFSKIKDVSAFPAPAKTVGGIKMPEAKKANDIKGSDTSQAQNTNGSAIGMDIRYEVKGYDNNLAGQLGAIQRSIRENPGDFFSGIAAAATNAASVGLSDEAFKQLRLREPDTLSFMAGRVIGGVAATTKSSAGMVGGLAKIVTGSGAMLGSIVLTKGTGGLGASVGVIGILQGLAIAGAGAAQVSYNGAVVASAGSALSKDVNMLFIKAANASGGSGAGRGKSGTGFNITEKISQQMGKRGWTNDTLETTVKKPFTTRSAKNKATGNDATAYFNKDGSYVVKHNKTGDVIQIINRNDPDWVPDPTINNPYVKK
jgi:peptidoglycan hydrolase-like protein with peptidoglycan-binding domain